MPAALEIRDTTPDPVRILLIEADQDCAERIAAALGRIEWAYAFIDTAASLRQALARLKLEKFDLVLADLELPDCSGLPALDELAQAFERHIVVLAEADGSALRDLCIAHGASDVLPKAELGGAALERVLRAATAQAGGVRSLRDSEARFRKTFELAGSGIAHLDLDGRLARVNRKLCEILGYAEDELLGQPLGRFAHPDDLHGGGAERRFLGKDGATVWVELSAARVRDAEGAAGYDICVMQDITERKEVEARQAAHARYQEAIGRFGQSALTRRDASELLAEAVETARCALGVREVSYVQAAGRGTLRVEGDALSPEARAFLGTLESLLSTGLQRIESEGKLSFLARFDPLTGLANRAVLAERLSQALVQARLRGEAVAVLCADLDDFSVVNETLGHSGGDALLKETAMRLLGVVRGGDTVARLSGDQFAVVLGDLARAFDAGPVAQMIVEALSQPFAAAGKETLVTASVGIAVFPGDGKDAETLLSAAAAAMHRAKQSGRNGYQFFTSEISRHTRLRAQLALELRRALARDEFTLVYQAKVDLRSRLICGAEALLRWQHPERGLMPPSQFVPVLEETGLIVPVGEWVLARVCEDLKAWHAAGRRRMPVAVNLSARQFRQRELDRRIGSQLQAAGVDAALIELEITESQLMEDPEHAARVMHRLRDSGIRAAIDDFGTGYSSLAYLTRLPVAALKIDRSFVAHALTDAADAAIVRAIIDMAHTLDFTVVAEGVESDGQIAFLRRFGCEQAQGYFFAPPMSAKDFTALI